MKKLAKFSLMFVEVILFFFIVLFFVSVILFQEPFQTEHLILIGFLFLVKGVKRMMIFPNALLKLKQKSVIMTYFIFSSLSLMASIML